MKNDKIIPSKAMKLTAIYTALKPEIIASKCPCVDALETVDISVINSAVPIAEAT